MAEERIELGGLPHGQPGPYDTVAGVDIATGEARQFPMPQAGVPRSYATRASLPAASGFAEGYTVWVNNDPTPANNGTWAVLGGAWVQSADRVTGLEGRVAELDEFAARKVVGKNLFNKAAVTPGVALNDSGGTFAASGRNVSDYIPVDASSAYRVSGSGVNKLSWYTAAKVNIGVATLNPVSVTSPATAAFARLDITNAGLDVVQFEAGSTPTPYEPYTLVLPVDPHSVGRDEIKDGAVTRDAIDAFEVMPWHLDDVTFLNCHDGSLRSGVRYDLTDGVTDVTDAAFDSTYWIAARPGTQYTANEMSRVFFYDRNRKFISVSPSLTFTTPASCHWMRFNLTSSLSYRFQVNEGPVATAPWPQPYLFRINKLLVPEQTKSQITAITGRQYNLADAWYAWLNGEKFPIAFLGDSTTQGTGTTPVTNRTLPYEDTFGVDFVAAGAYPAILQGLIRQATGSSVARCYNAGFHGTSSTYALANIAAILGGAYADAKMVGISHGINDRTANAKLYATNFYRDIEGIIRWCLANGKQPFLMTTQPTTMPAFPGSGSGPDIESVANRIKRELAAKWGLELVDVNAFGRDFQTYSAYPLLSPSSPPTGIYEAVNNTIHWANIGHKYEAEVLFAHICPRTVWTDKGEVLDFASQFVKSVVPFGSVSQLAVFNNGFKIQAKYAKATADDEQIQEFWLFNNYRGRLSLTAHAADAVGFSYVKVNGVATVMDSVSKPLGLMDMGLHRIEAWSGATTAVNWCGFKAVP